MRLVKHASIESSPLRLFDLPIPSPGKGQALIRVLTCGICHTDLHTVEGDIHPPNLPITPGHQVVGVVEALGKSAGNFVKIGDRVGVTWLHAACRECLFCRSGHENLCAQAVFTGFHVDGGYAEWMLSNVQWLLPLQDGIDDLQAAPLLCAGIIGFRSLRLADLQPGEWLGLVGFGASAHLAIQVARHWGCRVAVFSRSSEHRKHAASLGAEWTGGIEEHPPNPLDRAVIFAPSGNLVPKTLEKLRPGGTLAINAVTMSDLPAMPYGLIYGERTLRSVANATYQDGVEFLKLANEIGIRASVQAYPLQEANRGLQDLKASRVNGEGVLVI